MSKNQGSSTQAALTDAYSTGFLSKDFPTELERLHTLERWADPASLAMLEKAGIQQHWRCLEVGAGAGSLAYWMAERCPDGRVIAADIDPRYLDVERAPNLEIVKFDLTRDDFPERSFDLIHTRMVLSHLPDRDSILRRMVGWLAPGGAMVLEDYYMLPIDQMSEGKVRRIFDAIHRAFIAQGTSTDWTRKIPARLVENGLTEISLSLTPLTLGLGDPSDKLWRLGFEQFIPMLIARGYFTEADILEMRTSNEPPPIDIAWMLLSASGRRR